MIVCTACGTRNPDAACACLTCGRKLQSSWAAPGTPPAPGEAGGGAPNARPNGVAGANAPLDLDALGAADKPPEAGMQGGAWETIAPVEHKVDPHAARLVRVCAETWTYALALIAGAAATSVTEDWRYLAGAIVVAAGMAWARGI
jgi:hypothetical protein